MEQCLIQGMKTILKVVEFNEFQSLKDRWDDCLIQSLDNNIFSTWEWLSIWWKHFGEGKKLVILLVENEKEILAIAPFVYSEHNFLGFGKIKKISFVGSPDSDYNSFILKEKKVRFLELVFDYLNKHVDWDYLELKDIPENSATMDLLRSMHLKKYYKHWEERQSNICPYISLPTSVDVFLKELGREMRRNLRRYSRKLEKEYRVESKKYDKIGSVKEAMETFFRLHQMRWKSKAELGAFNKPIFRDFHSDVAKCFAEKGWLRLHFLTVNDEPISALYGFEYNQKVYGYLSGWNPQFYQYEVGSLSMMYDIQECIHKGLKEYDLMRGSGAYKRRWTTKARKNLEIRFVQKGLFPRIYLLLRKNSKISSMFSKFRMEMVDSKR
jgi:CelD/BcsL family acetyltransferase involved in cellulose biosynthesis